MIFRIYLLILITLLLTGCGGSSNNGSDSDENNTVSNNQNTGEDNASNKTIDITGTWNHRRTVAECPDIEEIFTQQFNDNDNDNLINTWVSDTGSTINMETCELESTEATEQNIESYFVPNTMNAAYFEFLIANVVSISENIPSQNINVSVSKFTENEIRYVVTIQTEQGTLSVTDTETR